MILDEKVLPVLPASLTSHLSLYPIFPPAPPRPCGVTHDLVLLTVPAVAMYGYESPNALTPRTHPVFRFFKELEERHQQNIVIDDISDIVLRHAQANFDPYVTYCSNEVYQQRTLQRLV